MYNVPLRSSYFLGGIVAALVAINVSGRLVDFMRGEQYPRPQPQSLVEAVSSKMQVDRSHKSDQLPKTRADPMANTSSILKDASMPGHAAPSESRTPAWPATLGTTDEKRAPTVTPAPLLYCETLASPNSDPVFGHIIGRCLV